MRQKIVALVLGILLGGVTSAGWPDEDASDGTDDGSPSVVVAQQKARDAVAPSAGSEGLTPEIADELSPHPELGPRTLQDISPEAAEIRRRQLLVQSRRVMPSVPAEVKKSMFDMAVAVSPWSVRDFFNFSAWKMKVDDGISFDEVVESMDIKANELNFKKTGHSEIWKDIGAITGLPTTRVEVLQYCDAIVGRRMLDYSPEFLVFIPCRIGVYEDASGEIWLMTLDWDVAWLAYASHPESQLDQQLLDDGKRIRDVMEQIMIAGATGAW